MKTQRPRKAALSVDLKQHLLCYFFLKQNYDSEHVDRIVAKIIDEFLKISIKGQKPIVLWRGQYQNSLDMDMWVLGIAKESPTSTHDAFYEAVRPGYDDFGEYRRIDTGAHPYLLFERGRLLKIVPRKRGSQISLQIANRSWEVDEIESVPASSVPKKRTPGQDWLAFSRSFSRSKQRADHHWPDVLKKSAALVAMRESSLDTIGDVALARFLTKVLGIRLIEYPTNEHGRTWITPRWYGDGRSVELDGFDVVMALDSRLKSKIRAITLAHEFGHYIYHFGHLEVMFQFYAALQSDVGLESRVAKIIPQEFFSEYSRITESRADLFASLMMLPAWAEVAMKNFLTIAYTPVPETAEGALLAWLRKYFISDSGHISWQHVESNEIDAAYEANRLRTQPYNHSATLFDRIGWWVFNREQSAIEWLREQEKHLKEVFLMISEEVHRANTDFGRLIPTVPPTKSQQIVRRISVVTLESELALGQAFWDPLILETTPLGPIQCYLGLVEHWDANAPAGTLWKLQFMPHQSPQPINYWIQRAQQTQAGIMLFPMNPAERFHRMSEAQSG